MKLTYIFHSGFVLETEHEFTDEKQIPFWEIKREGENILL